MRKPDAGQSPPIADDVFKTRFVIMSSGPLNKPKLPGIPGIENFKGHTFHTSRWDYNYTGGDTTGGLHKLQDKRVGIIGTGATAIQCIPHLGEHAQQLYVFQRTPSSVDERNNTPTNPEWAKTLKPGWQAYRNRNFTALLDGVRVEGDEVGDKWTSPLKKLGDLLNSKSSDLSGEEKALLAEIADFQKMNEIRDRVATTVQRPGRRPKRSSRGSGNGASVPPSTTSTSPPSTGPTSSLWTPAERASIA